MVANHEFISPSIFRLSKALFLAIVVSCSGFQSAFAQLNSGNLYQLTERDGMPSNTVNSVIVDRLGYLWIGTYNGLTRYNGYDFEKFYSDPNDSTAIQGMITYAILEDSKGKIWVGTNPSYVEVYDPVKRTFKAFNYGPLVDTLVSQPPLYGYTVKGICEDNTGAIYFGIDPGTNLKRGLLYKKPGEDTIRQFPLPDGMHVENVYVMKNDREGNVWILSHTGIFKIEEGQMKNMTSLFDVLPPDTTDFVSTFGFGSDDHVWFVSRRGKVFDYDIANKTFQQFESGIIEENKQNRVMDSWVDPHENLWIATFQKLIQFDPTTHAFRQFNSGVRKDLEQIGATGMAFDSFGNTHISTYNHGIIRYDERPVFYSFIADPEDTGTILTGWVNVIQEIDPGKIIIHSDLGLTIVDINKKKILERFPSGIYPQFGFMTYMWENSPGVMYVSSWMGLHSFDLDTRKMKEIQIPGVPTNLQLTHRILDAVGNEWIASHGGIYRKLPSETQFTKVDLSKVEGGKSYSNDVTELIQGKDVLWIVSNEGLFSYQMTSKVIKRHLYDASKGQIIRSQDINSLYEDENGVVWIGQWQGGLARYDPKTEELRSYTIEDGLPSMAIQAIVGDALDGTLWLSTFNGLSRFDPAKEKFVNFSIFDGIQSSQFADESYLRTSDGYFIFGGSNGITAFKPEEFNIKYDPPLVLLTDLKLFNESIIPGQGSILKDAIYDTKAVELSHDQNDVTIDFLAIHYSNPSKNKYAYILENFDDDWREVVNQRQAYYPNLPPGEYTFRVKAANDKGVWNEEGALLSIIIHPPWWMTWWAYAAYAALFILFISGIIRWRTNALRAEKEFLEEKVSERTSELKSSLDTLQATQKQLIQSEKMASLGELTAGIAHEIQNPLNFVNNFSEVNTELIAEMKEALEKGQSDEAAKLADDLNENEKKINYHGRRADGIVKSMLQHSRSNAGKKEQTDINLLAEEYLRLSYHGLRAKDKSFNAKFNTQLDPTLHKISVVPQEIGRVLLNLINNSFYSVSEKRVTAGEGYEPTVTVSTKMLEGEVEIRVADNGNGMPDSLREKIFQPFFTTKPTGQGTGLGLSMSYDIITNAHGGKLSVDSESGEGATFIIVLPIDDNK